MLHSRVGMLRASSALAGAIAIKFELRPCAQLLSSTFAHRTLDTFTAINTSSPSSPPCYGSKNAPRQQRGFAVTTAARFGGAAPPGGGSPSSSLSRQVRVSHILLTPENDALAKELLQRVNSGEEDISSLAAKHSRCPSRAKGGDIGWVTPGQTVPEFEQAAFAASLGRASMCKTQFGIHILMVTEERKASQVKRLTVQQAAEMLTAARQDPSMQLQLVDVREEWEAQTASIRGVNATLLPLSKFEEWSPKVAELLDPSAPTLCLCHHGIRSQQAAQYLVNEAGFTDVSNIVGGIDAYSRGVDGSIPQY